MPGGVRISCSFFNTSFLNSCTCSGSSAGIWAGARTAAIICTVLQFGFNELGVARVKFVSRKIQESQPRPEIAPPPATPEKPRMSIFDRLMTVIGFRKLTDEEYLKALKKQRDEALERIAVLEQQRREEESHDAEGTT